MQSERSLVFAWLIVASTIIGVTAPAHASTSGAQAELSTEEQPVPFFSFTPQGPNTNQTVHLDASNSYDNNGQITSYQWDYETSTGTETATGETIQLDWSAEGDYDIELTVTDDSGNSSSLTRTITVTDGQLVSNQGNPLINDSEGVLRVITNNDPIVNSSEGYTSPWLVEAGLYEQRLINNNVTAMRIDNRVLSPKQAKLFGALGDTYRETLSTPVFLPTVDEYKNFDWSETVRAPGSTQRKRIRFVNFTASPGEIQTSNSNRSVWVLTKNKPGYRNLKNVKVKGKAVSSSGPRFKITNKENVKIRDNHAVRYKKYNREVAQWGFFSLDRNYSQLPVIDGEPRYRVETATVSGKWQGESTVIQDHYTQIARITEGAIYGNYWLANPDGIEITTFNDFIGKAPDDYESTSQCTYEICNNGTCGIETGNETKYENWEYTGHEYNNQIYHNGEYHNASENNRLLFNVQNPVHGPIVPYSELTITLEHTYGVDSSCKPDWEETETVTVQNTYRGKPVEIKPSTAEDLNTTVYLLDKGPKDKELQFEVVGNQRPAENPLEQIYFQGSEDNPNRTMSVRTPWTFIPQALYDNFDLRPSAGLSPPEMNPQREMGYITRDYLDGGEYKFSGGNMFLTVNNKVQSQTFEGVKLDPKVNDSEGIVPLYKHIGGPINVPTNNYSFQNPTAKAYDIYGNEYNTNIVTREYTDTQIHLKTEGDTLIGRLEVPNGTALPNRTIRLNGTEKDAVITDENGEFEANITGDSSSVRAKFRRTPFHKERSNYYEESTQWLVTPTNIANLIETPISYIGDAITNLVLVADWLVLGLVFLWYSRTADD
jgi:hypothetical protein